MAHTRSQLFTRRDFMRLTAVTSTGLVLTACAPGGMPAPAPAADEIVTLDYWTWFYTGELKSPDPHLNLLEELAPGYSYNLAIQDDYATILKTAAAADELPDLMGWGLIDQAPLIVFLEPMEGHMAEEYGANWRDRFKEGVIERAEMRDPTGEHMLVIPYWKAGAGGLAYSLELLEKVGASELPSDYAGFRELCQALIDAGVTTPVTFPGKGGQSSVWLDYLAGQIEKDAMLKAASGELPWNGDVWVQTMVNYKMMFDDGCFGKNPFAIAWSDHDQLIAAGKAAMHYAYETEPGPRANPDYWPVWRYGDMPPAQPGLQPGQLYFYIPMSIGVWKDSPSPRKEGAIKMAVAMVSDAYQELMSVTFGPVLKGMTVQPTGEAAFDASVEAHYARPGATQWGVIALSPEVIAGLEDATQAVFLTGADIQEEMDKVQAAQVALGS